MSGTRKGRHADYRDCPCEATLDRIGGKWKSALLLRLGEGTQRYNALRRALPKVSQRTLTQQLRELEADGLVARAVFPEVPPRVEYSLTPLGRTLMPAIDALRVWGETHVLGA